VVTSTFPLKLRAQWLVLTWKYHRWTLGVDYALLQPSYLVADPTDPNNSAAIFVNQGSQHVPSQVYHDIFGSYRFQESGTSTSTSNSWQRLLNGL